MAYPKPASCFGSVQLSPWYFVEVKTHAWSNSVVFRPVSSFSKWRAGGLILSLKAPLARHVQTWKAEGTVSAFARLTLVQICSLAATIDC